MSKLNIQPLSRLISSSSLIDPSPLPSPFSLLSRFHNHRQTHISLRQIQQYHPDHTIKSLLQQSISIYHRLRQAHNINDIVTIAQLFSPLLFKEWRIDQEKFKFYDNLVNAEVMRVRVKKEEGFGVWGQIMIRMMHEEKGGGMKGYVQKVHWLERKLMVEDNNEGWRVKVFQN